MDTICVTIGMMRKRIVQNRKAFAEYFIDSRIEAGISLLGTEVKSLRGGKASLKEAYAAVDRDQVYLYHCHIAPYSHGNLQNHDPMRRRRLLLHKREILRLSGKVRERGFTLVPLELYFKGSRVKVELGLARGKKLHDKRTAIKERELKIDAERAFRDSKKY